MLNMRQIAAARASMTDNMWHDTSLEQAEVIGIGEVCEGEGEVTEAEGDQLLQQVYQRFRLPGKRRVVTGE